MKVVIEHSLFSDPIAKQLKSKKIVFNKLKVKLFQEQAFQAMSLHFHELITTAQRDSILNKINTRIENHITELSMELDFTKK